MRNGSISQERPQSSSKLFLHSLSWPSGIQEDQLPLSIICKCLFVFRALEGGIIVADPSILEKIPACTRIMHAKLFSWPSSSPRSPMCRVMSANDLIRAIVAVFPPEVRICLKYIQMATFSIQKMQMVEMQSALATCKLLQHALDCRTLRMPEAAAWQGSLRDRQTRSSAQFMLTPRRSDLSFFQQSALRCFHPHGPRLAVQNQILP